MIDLTVRDFDILETLTRRVRLLSIEQTTRLWWPTTCRHSTARRRMRQLAAAGFVERTIINAHPLLSVSRPLARWAPDGPAPDPRRVSKMARKRWKQVAGPVEVFTCTPLAANLFGSTAGHLPELLHRDHDLLLAQVFIWYREHQPAEAKRWIGEDTLPKAGYQIKDPDAFLVADDGEFLRVIESAGRYQPAQIESFHDHCAENDLPYELW